MCRWSISDKETCRCRLRGGWRNDRRRGIRTWQRCHHLIERSSPRRWSFRTCGWEVLLGSHFSAITFHTHHLQNHRMMNQTVNRRHGGHRILECVIMPLSLIVLLVEAILEAVSCLLLLNIPSRASLWLAGIQ